MPSQVDYDQSGTVRFLQRRYLGPSLGWVDAPDAILRITSGGTTNVLLGNSVISVNFNGPVTIQLPQFNNSNPAQPGLIRDMPIVIADVGGFAGANPITILSWPGETISSLRSTTIATPYGALILIPDPVAGGCTVAS
jgi:hypothetical protein